MRIAEDVRLATRAQVRHLTEEDKCVLPHINGFALSQLVDQLHEHGRKEANPLIYLRAPGGTAIWLAKQLPFRFQVSLDVKHYDYRTLAEFDTLEHASLVDAFPKGTTCLVLTNLHELEFWQKNLMYPHLRRIPWLVYDPERRLHGQPGEYYMGSSIWRKHGHRAT